MKFRVLIGKVFGVGLVVLSLVSCKELPKEMEVETRRELCQYDNPAVFKNGYDIWLGTQPLSWRRVNGTEFRLLNYGAGEATEIAVGQVGSGGVLANINRWKGQFDQKGLESIDRLETFEMLDGRKAYLIDLTGTFQKKMGGMPVKAEGWALTGVICDVSGGTLVTIKMMGPEEEVVAQRENLIKFAKSIRINTLQTPSERSKKGSKADEVKEGGY